MKKTRDTKKKWTGWIDEATLAKVEAEAKKEGIPCNYYIERVLKEAVKVK